MSLRSDLCAVGYTYRAHAYRTAFAHAAAQGYRFVELRDYQDCDWSDAVVEATWARLALAALRCGLQPWACFRPIHLAWRGSPATSLERCRRWMGAMRAAGIRLWHAHLLLVGVGSSQGADDELYQRGADRLWAIGAMAQAEGVSIAIESHMGTIHDTADGLWRLLHGSGPGILASLDFANLLIADPGTDLIREIRRFSRRIGYVHIKNILLQDEQWHWNIPVGLGSIDYASVLAELHLHYRGPLGVEYCGSGDCLKASEEDARHLHALAGQGRPRPGPEGLRGDRRRWGACR